MSNDIATPEATKPEGPFILVIGTPFSGLDFFGPFETEDDAESLGIGNDDWWVHEPEVPHGGTVDPTGSHIVVIGSPMSGISVYGPYESDARALEAAEQFEGDWHVVELRSPDE